MPEPYCIICGTDHNNRTVECPGPPAAKPRGHATNIHRTQEADVDQFHGEIQAAAALFAPCGECGGDHPTRDCPLLDAKNRCSSMQPFSLLKPTRCLLKHGHSRPHIDRFGVTWAEPSTPCVCPNCKMVLSDGQEHGMGSRATGGTEYICKPIPESVDRSAMARLIEVLDDAYATRSSVTIELSSGDVDALLAFMRLGQAAAGRVDALKAARLPILAHMARDVGKLLP